MSVPIPIEILKEVLRVQLNMPQMVGFMPPGYSLTVRVFPPAGKGIVSIGTSLGGHLVDGSDIPPYNFITNKGICWQATYVNKPPLETLVSGTIYLTKDLLYRPIYWGPGVITEHADFTVVNRLDQGFFFALMIFLYELPLERIMEIFRPPA